MYPDTFEYHRPDTVREAINVLGEQPEAEVLAGGHSLIPAMKTGLASPDTLVDVGEIGGLRGIDRGDDNTEIGALTRYVTLCKSERLWEDVAVLAEAAGEVGDIQVRNRGTIGGNVAHADPASDLPGAILAGDGTVVARGPDGEREIAADDFFHGMYATDLREGELLTAVRVPHLGENAGSAYVKRPNPSSGYALVGVAAVLCTDGGVVQSARVAANGVMDRAVRLTPTEDALTGIPVDDDEALSDAADRAGDDLTTGLMMEDIHASSEFRENLLGIHTEEAIETAIDRVQ